MSKQKTPEPAIEPAITDSKAALATGGPEKAEQAQHFTEAVQNDTPQESLDNARLTGDGAEGEKGQQEEITIPAQQTDSGKPETITRPATATDSGTTLHDAIKGQQAQILSDAPKQYKWVDFGPHAHDIAIVSLGQRHYDVRGPVYDVTIAAGPSGTENYTFPGVPEAWLKE